MMERETDIYWLWLSSLPEVGINSKAALTEAFGTAESAFKAEKGVYSHIEGITERDAEILELRDLTSAYYIMKQCEREKVDIVTIDSPEYPRRLKEIYGPPYVLYVRGNLPPIDDEPLLAVVGTRRATEYGKRMSRDIAYQYAACGGTVVSGLTAGIDECGAEGAVAAGGKVIGFLGTSISSAYGELVDSVLEKGALISEYAPGTKSQKIYFRHRNRIGAGISAAVVAVEAPEKSGTALFVAEALEQGKQIFAVPGNADSETCAGTLKFIKDGAVMVTCGREIAEEMSYVFPNKLNPVSTDTYRKVKKSVDRKNDACYIDELSKITNGMTEQQIKVVTAIALGCTTVDAIVQNTSLPAHIVLAQLTLLEIRKIIARENGSWVIRQL